VFALFLLACCNTENKKDSYQNLDRRDRIRLMQYMQEGRRLYTLYCANCHQPEGTGLARLYPPLRNSDYLKANKTSVICGIKYGQKGPITVNGIEFNQIMPPVPNITDLEIAEIATFIYTEFADTAQIITMNDIRSILDQCDSTDSLEIKK
jgi:mono/diheme cytochrome c family protein